MEKVLIADMTSPEFQIAVDQSGTVIIPLGSVEQLGRHGPLGADWFVATEVSVLLGQKTDSLVAPAVPYGDTLELDFWPGTVCLETEVLTDLYLSIARSFLKYGFGDVVFLNCHSLNLRSVDAACRTLHTEGFRACIADWWKVAFMVSEDLVESIVGASGHGGETITSVIMALRPGTVNLSSASHEQPKEMLAFYSKHGLNSGSPFRVYGDFQDYCETGSWGDVSKSSEEKGRIIIDRAVNVIADFICEFKKNDRSTSNPTDTL